MVVVAAGVSVAGAIVLVSASSTKELGSHMENHSFSSAHVKPLAQQVLPCQPCPPHCSHASAQLPVLCDGAVVVAAGVGVVVAAEAGAVVVVIAVVTEACAVLVGAADDAGVVVATGVCGAPPPP
jgi:hypothetical protein